jgi:hypothetical protein
MEKEYSSRVVLDAAQGLAKVGTLKVERGARKDQWLLTLRHTE